MKIKTVAVLGAGAVGSYVIWGLSRRKDIRLGVLAEGKRAEKLRFIIRKYGHPRKQKG